MPSPAGDATRPRSSSRRRSGRSRSPCSSSPFSPSPGRLRGERPRDSPSCPSPPSALLLLPFALADLPALRRELLAYSGIADFGWTGLVRGVTWLATGDLARSEARFWPVASMVSKALFLAAWGALVLATRRGWLALTPARACLATFVAFNVFYGALSAQYLLWVVPLAVLWPGPGPRLARRGGDGRPRRLLPLPGAGGPPAGSARRERARQWAGGSGSRGREPRSWCRWPGSRGCCARAAPSLERRLPSASGLPGRHRGHVAPVELALPLPHDLEGRHQPRQLARLEQVLGFRGPSVPRPCSSVKVS